MISVFIGTLEMAKADTQSSDSNGNPDTWSMFQNNLSHTGYTTSTSPTTNHVLWSYITGNAVESSPAVVDGVVYVGSDDGKVYALSAATGALIWSHTIGDKVPSLGVANGVIYVGRVSPDLSGRGAVFALNAATGSVLWNFPTDDAVSSSPSVSNGVVYVGSEDGESICFERFYRHLNMEFHNRR